MGSRSRLYRRRFLRARVRLAAFFKLREICALWELSACAQPLWGNHSKRLNLPGQKADAHFSVKYLATFQEHSFHIFILSNSDCPSLPTQTSINICPKIDSFAFLLFHSPPCSRAGGPKAGGFAQHRFLFIVVYLSVSYESSRQS